MKHVLVIRLSALGDVAILVPVMRAVASANAGVRFTVAGPPLLQPLFDGMSGVEYMGLKKKQSPLKIYRALEGVGADGVADLHKVNRVGMALVLLRIRHLFDFSFRISALRKGRLSRFLFLRHLRMQARRPQWQRYGDVFRRLGLDVPTAASRLPHPGLPSGECEGSKGVGTFHIRDSKSGRGHPALIGLAPFAQHKGKVWPWENSCALALSLAGRGMRVVLFGSREEAPQLEGLASQHEGIESLAGRLTFGEELQAIGSLALMVSMDSANMHFASVLGVPVVSIWGATHPDFGFYGYGQRREDALCAGLDCQPCSAYGSKPCRLGDYRCLRAITPDTVLEKVLQRVGDQS